MGEHSSICLLGFLDDRWVISIPTTGPPTIWDTQGDPPTLYKLPESALHFFQDETSNATAVVDLTRVTLSSGFGGEYYRSVRIYRVYSDHRF